MLWVKVRCPAISLIASSMAGSRSLNLSLCGRSGAGFDLFAALALGGLSFCLAGAFSLRLAGAFAGTVRAEPRRARAAPAERTGWTAWSREAAPTVCQSGGRGRPAEARPAVGGRRRRGVGGQSSTSGQSSAGRVVVSEEVGPRAGRRPVERRERLGLAAAGAERRRSTARRLPSADRCGGSRRGEPGPASTAPAATGAGGDRCRGTGRVAVGAGGRRVVEVEPEVEVGIGVGSGGYGRPAAGHRRCRRAAEQVEERRVDVQRGVDRRRRAAGPAAAPGRRPPHRARARRRSSSGLGSGESGEE